MKPPESSAQRVTAIGRRRIEARRRWESISGTPGMRVSQLGWWVPR
ncbi:hypothetical protein GCM10010404_68660 [Nonomuraea africana]